MSVRRTWSLLSSLVLAAAGLGAAPSSTVLAAETYSYPSVACPLNADRGLQDCIDAAGPGDTIVLTNEINPDGAVTIERSLTLRATSRSLRPVLPHIVIRSDGSVVDVTVQDVRVTDRVQVGFGTASSGHSVTLRRIEVGREGMNADGVSFDSQTAASLTIEGSFIRVAHSGAQDDALRVFAEDPDGPVTVRIVGSRITARGNPESGSGIALTAIGDGTVSASIRNNVVWDVGRCVCGAAAGISINPTGAIRMAVDIVGNTIERSRTDGISQRNGLTGGGRLSLDVFDNVISHARFFAIRLDSGEPGTLRFRAGYNARYANGLGSNLDGQSAGPGNLSVNPRFVDRADGDLRLRPDSPLIDRGLICNPGGLSIRDAAGRHRLKGRSVDIGAYERGAGSASGVVKMGTSGKDTLVGTSGRDILCGFGGVDTLCAKDGKGGDYVNGGSGRDKARTDSGDVRRSIEATANCFT